MFAIAAPVDLPFRLGAILNGLRRVLAVRAGRDQAMAPMLLLLWNRLSRILTRVSAIAARYRAGTLRAAAKARRPPVSQPPPPPDPLPRHPAWAVRQAPECAAYGENLRRLLAEPEVIAMIEAAPQLRRLLRPLWRMLQAGPPPPVLRSVPESPARLARGSDDRRAGVPPPPAALSPPFTICVPVAGPPPKPA